MSQKHCMTVLRIVKDLTVQLESMILSRMFQLFSIFILQNVEQLLYYKTY